MKVYDQSLMLLSCLALLSCSGKSHGIGDSDSPKIFTTGQAERRVEPNMAKVTFAILTRAQNAEKARSENASKVSVLIKKVKEMKIPESDLESLDYRIREIINYQNGTQRIEAYEVNNRMQIKLLDVKKGRSTD
ncbi:MAG: SIMPL domain-containing protein [Bdellovibrionota bacterium]